MNQTTTPKNGPTHGLSRVLFIRVDAALLKSLRDRLDIARKKHPGHVISLADMVREILWEGVKP